MLFLAAPHPNCKARLTYTLLTAEALLYPGLLATRPSPKALTAFLTIQHRQVSQVSIVAIMVFLLMWEFEGVGVSKQWVPKMSNCVDSDGDL